MKKALFAAALLFATTAFATNRPNVQGSTFNYLTLENASYGTQVPTLTGTGITTTDSYGNFTDSINVYTPLAGYMKDDGTGNLQYVPVTTDTFTFTVASDHRSISCGRYCGRVYNSVLSSVVMTLDGVRVVAWVSGVVILPLEMGKTYNLSVAGLVNGSSNLRLGLYKVQVTSPWSNIIDCSTYQNNLINSELYLEEEIIARVRIASQIAPGDTYPKCVSPYVLPDLLPVAN